MSLHPWCWVADHPIYKSKNMYYRITAFSEQRVHFVTSSRVQVQGGPHGGLKLPLSGGKNNIEGCRVPPDHPSPPTPKYHGYSESRVWLGGIELEFHRFGAPMPTAFPFRIGCLDWGDQITGEKTISHFPLSHRDL